MSGKKNLKKLIEESIENIHSDRKSASILLEDAIEHIGSATDGEGHRAIGQTAAKYLETLQRSNEQLVKIASLLQDLEDDEFGDLDKEDKEKIYEEFEQTIENSITVPLEDLKPTEGEN